MFNVICVPLSDQRRKALVAASNRLGFRLEFALAGRPACPMTFDGYAIPGATPYVLGAPRHAEDPRTVAIMLARVDACLNSTTEYRREARPTC